MRANAIWILALLLPACGGTREAPRTDERVLLLLSPAASEEEIPEGVAAVARVEVAADEVSRQRGLMERNALPPEGGMLFLYRDERPREFWMKNTRIPLSIAYATGTGRIVRILDMSPGVGTPDPELPRYPSGEPAKMALEMESGWFSRRGIRVGDRILLDPYLAGIQPR